MKKNIKNIKVEVYLDIHERNLINTLRRYRALSLVLCKALERRSEWLSLKLNEIIPLTECNKDNLEKVSIVLCLDLDENREVYSFIKNLQGRGLPLLIKGAIAYVSKLSIEELISNGLKTTPEGSEKSSKLINNIPNIVGSGQTTFFDDDIKEDTFKGQMYNSVTLDDEIINISDLFKSSR